MKNPSQTNDSVPLAYRMPVCVMNVGDDLFTTDWPETDTPWPMPVSDDASLDCSEEAIPERDLSYRLPAGTACEEQTVEVVSAELRLDLARRLEELGMNSARAAVVASL